VPLVRSKARPERHFADSSITVRLAIMRLVRTWLTPFLRRERVRRAKARRAARAPTLGAHERALPTVTRQTNLLQ
jgi:hypothetical protein